MYCNILLLHVQISCFFRKSVSELLQSVTLCFICIVYALFIVLYCQPLHASWTVNPFTFRSLTEFQRTSRAQPHIVLTMGLLQNCGEQPVFFPLCHLKTVKCSSQKQCVLIFTHIKASEHIFPLQIVILEGSAQENR